MGYLMRYIIADERPAALDEIESALQKIDSAYAITNIEVDDLGDLMLGTQRLAIIEINRPGDDIYEDDLAEFMDLVGQGASPDEVRVREVLTAAQALVVIEAFWEGEDAESTLTKIDPLWDWLFANYAGLSQADSEGFYDQTGLILERNFTL
ncbi:MAG: hypothetical protein ABI690_28175 [Chloroflexota bacterium]